MRQDSTFWTGKRVLVTGGHGFLGQHLCVALTNLGAHVTAPTHVQFDLCEPHVTQHLLHLIRPSIVVHLAALMGGIQANSTRPGEFFHHNLIMGFNIIEACRQEGIEKLVVAGTACEYPAYASVPSNEKLIWDGYPDETNAPYGVAKRALWTMQEAYFRQYGLKSIHPVLANMYGPGDDFSDEGSHVIPALIRKFITARQNNLPTVTVWGTGQASRDFLYVKDGVQALILLAEKYDSIDPINVATGREIPIFALVEAIQKLTRYEGQVIWDVSKPDGQKRRSLNTVKMKHEMGWQATTVLEDGLAETIAWYEVQCQTRPKAQHASHQ